MYSQFPKIDGKHSSTDCQQTATLEHTILFAVWIPVRLPTVVDREEYNYDMPEVCEKI